MTSSKDYLAQKAELSTALTEAVKKVLLEQPENPTSRLAQLLSDGDNRKVVCVTGCTGYVASEVVKQCLELGWTVRGTARDVNDESKVGYLKKMAADLPGRLELVKADLLQPGAFDTVVDGCEYVFHTASPFFFGSEAEGVDAVNEKMIKPAVEGTKNVLGSVAKHKAGIKCVALTSSIVAITGFTGTDKIARADGKFSEQDWNETSTREAGAYLLSKTLAEKAAWEIAEKEGFKLTTICPAFVLGPANTDRNDGESIGFGLKLLKDGIVGLQGFPCVDVRDVGKAHIAACINPNSQGRYVLCEASQKSEPTHLPPCQLAPQLRIVFSLPNWVSIPRVTASTYGVPAWWAYDVLQPLGLPNIQKPDRPEGAEVAHTWVNDKVQSTEAWRAGLGIQLTDLKTTLVDMVTSMKVSHAAHLV